MEQYNFNIQRELMNGTILTAGYVGSRGYNMVNGYDETNLAMATTTNPYTWSPSTPKINPNFGRRQRSVILPELVRGLPSTSSHTSSRNPVVSTTNVSPSQCPTE